MKKLSLIYLLIAVVVIASCEKEKMNETTKTTDSKTDLLTIEKGWIIESGTITPAVNNSNNYLDVLDECSLDDITTYNKDKSACINQGAKKCKDDAEQKKCSERTWKFANDETKLILYDKVKKKELVSKLISISKTKLNLEVNTPDSVARVINVIFKPAP